ncbi:MULTISPECIES: cytochrome o ubiquinol oxidase subunit IV [Acetobacter]|uniref:Cytochrome bo(3) ubiquinol oxidase subunit 4 n=1 Tax=Acetobacter thailandicus TaxID=1502842 RepID=A0ABT3QDQ9_9PROT|nr:MULTISPECIES: cytochrome o ubiquinol oxidase subunit IV [Acetobacter]MBS0960171.1 cytochrome o ubiquinol oxidase subunit IV [Acetobacter thailandicus]MBS0979800.1 cytochrome o ubiquinol oxidase subunit IV [Acetobacter thailandicus]MBS0985396.1 cytochrome o ubiquinol oxidase subunit IV [Acetobacter thailandicus]MBS1004234.1 cytochrome o ubiquinol oxidase subunit IV [Acetobacter thailandicus]MCX2563438.1 cytochrome o ubiquinol oxidase subunit IV [Acetobacter thailandicus]
MSEHNTTSSGESHGSVSSYIIGFVLAVILTVLSFAIVVTHSLSPSATILTLSLLAIIQVVVHLHYFLHMGGHSEHRWNNICFVFTIGFVSIVIIGTLFVMNNAAVQMMSR